MRRTMQVHLRLSPGEFAALEAVRGLYGVARSQADVVTRLLRSECAGNFGDPACAEALRLLAVEEGKRGSAGRPATQPKRPPVKMHQTDPAPSPVRVGARFEHRDWREGGKAEGLPTVCEVTTVTRDGVRFRHVGRGGVLAKQIHGTARDLFEEVCVGRWLAAAPTQGTHPEQVPTPPALLAAPKSVRPARVSQRADGRRPQGRAARSTADR